MANRSQLISAVRDVVEMVAGRRISDTEPLITSGAIDSLSILKLIAALEQSLGIKIPVASVQPEDFDSVEMTLDTLERVARI